MTLMRRYFKACGQQPKVAVVGAAEGLGKWGPFAMAGFVAGLGFEPDPVEFEHLRQKFPWVQFSSSALGNQTRDSVTFYETAFLQCSSCLEPDTASLSPYWNAPRFAVKATREIALARFDDLCDRKLVPCPDLLQIDVQGFEYEVLDGFGAYLDNVVAIECESHFKRLYRGQKILPELVTYLDSRGFVLRHLESQGRFGGEYVEVNAYFVRLTDPRETLKRDLIRIWETVCDLPPAGGERTGLAGNPV